MEDKKAPVMGIGAALGIGIGVALGVALNNIALAVAFGAAFGAAFATTFGKKMERGGSTSEKLSPQTRRILFLLLGLSILAALLIIGYAGFR